MTPRVLNTGIEEVREHSTWFLVIGIALVILGLVAIGYTVEMTVVSVMFLGWLLIIAGLFEVVHGFTRRPWSGFFVNLLGGVLYAVVGLVMVANPARAAVVLTLLIAIVLIVAGVFRLFIALSTAPHHRGWLILNGAISIVLGVMIWDAWPVSGLWVIGLFIGIDMIFDGWTEIVLALSARRLPA
ncbi:MAG TPA: HdeD family acid-resistance protein [Candidatus Binataceae bacterium]|nr:HdeD family acid-resistance protein [Candidatus Binataceae bacterium]